MDRSDFVLIVDDMFLARANVKKALASIGFERVIESSNGKEALSVLRDEKVKMSFMILDWMMPEMTGIELLRAMRQEGLRQELPVVMLTAEAEVESVSAAEEFSVKSYIVKPVAQAVLAQRLLRIIGQQE